MVKQRLTLGSFIYNINPRLKEIKKKKKESKRQSEGNNDIKWWLEKVTTGTVSSREIMWKLSPAQFSHSSDRWRGWRGMRQMLDLVPTHLKEDSPSHDQPLTKVLGQRNLSFAGVRQRGECWGKGDGREGEVGGHGFPLLFSWRKQGESKHYACKKALSPTRQASAEGKVCINLFQRP